MTGRGNEGVVRIKIKARTKAIGADSVLESVGTQEAMRRAINFHSQGRMPELCGLRYLLGTWPSLINRSGREDQPGQRFEVTLPLDQSSAGQRAMDEAPGDQDLARRRYTSYLLKWFSQ